jgi:hypothetical protein
MLGTKCSGDRRKIPGVRMCRMKLLKTREVFVHSPYTATRVVNWLPDCVSSNDFRRGAYCWRFLATELMNNTLMYGRSVVGNKDY